MAGTISNFGYFLIIITSNEKFTGIIKAIRLPNKNPLRNESPTIIKIPNIAKIIEKKPIKDTFSFKKKYPKIAKNNVWVLIINTTLATDKDVIA